MFDFNWIQIGIIMTKHVLKLSLGLLFGTSNILSLGQGNSRTHLSDKEKNEKNVDDHDLRKKIEKRKKSRAKIKKKVSFCQK